MKELVEFLLEKKVSEEAYIMMLSIPNGQNQIGNWFRVVEDNYGIDQPSLKYYNDELKECPHNCKEFKGQKYVYFLEDIGAYGNKFY